MSETELSGIWKKLVPLVNKELEKGIDVDGRISYGREHFDNGSRYFVSEYSYDFLDEKFKETTADDNRQSKEEVLETGLSNLRYFLGRVEVIEKNTESYEVKIKSNK